MIQSMEKRVVVTGMGVITPVGQSLNEFWSNIKAGVCGIRPIEGIEEELTVSVAGQVQGFDPKRGIPVTAIRRGLKTELELPLGKAYADMVSEFLN